MTTQERLSTMINYLNKKDLSNKEDLAKLIIQLQSESILDFKSWNTGCDCNKCLEKTYDYLYKNGFGSF
jgi:hypothetical protein